MCEEVIEDGFLDRFTNADYAGCTPIIGSPEIVRILKEFKRLRMTDETIYLRNAAVSSINGMINMSLSCDGTHYIDHHKFFAKLDAFKTTDPPE